MTTTITTTTTMIRPEDKLFTVNYDKKPLGLVLKDSNLGVSVHRKCSSENTFNNMVEIGDIVMSINEIDVQSKTFKMVIKMIKSTVPMYTITFKRSLITLTKQDIYNACNTKISEKQTKGTRKYNELIESYYDQYHDKLSFNEKLEVRKKIQEEIINICREEGGRFLKLKTKDDGTRTEIDEYVEMDDSDATNKIRKSFLNKSTLKKKNTI